MIESGDCKFEVAAPGWGAVLVDSGGAMYAYPVIVWCFEARYDGARIVPMISATEETPSIENAFDYENCVGLLGPGEDIERFREAAIEIAQALYDLSPLEALAGVAE